MPEAGMVMVTEILKMVKPKLPEGRSSNQDLPMSSSDAATDFTLLPHDWVIVKKQKVNVLIPPLPASSHPASSEKGSEERLVLGNDKPANGVVEPENRQTLSQMRDDVRREHGLTTVKQRRVFRREFSINDGPAMLSQMMKASNLERKLLRAGGLSRWLTSMGLERFIRIFHARRVGKFQLVNMSMSKLKDMGIHAVGPRRKLIHAIECGCHPYCFEAL